LGSELNSHDINPKGIPWLESANLLLDLELEGLMVECPKCSHRGIPIRKYEKKKKIPISVVHNNGSGLLNICHLHPDQARSIRSHISVTAEDLSSLIGHCAPYVLFSGGRDSLCTLVYVQRIAEYVGRKTKAVHVDTTVGIPLALDYVEEICLKLNVELEIVRPKVDFFTLAKNWGIPSYKYRWCCRELKIKPLADYIKAQPDPKLVLDGIRAAESSSRAKYLPIWHHPSFNCISISPIFYWSDEDVRKYIDEIDVPKEMIEKLETSPECWCGAYKSRSDFEKLYQLCPQLYDKLARLERSSKTGYTFIYENGNRMSLDSLKRKMEQVAE